MTEPFYIGKRLSFDEHLCTVRYVGPVVSTKGEWLGIEWDDSTRGKHAGYHNGRKYFDCISSGQLPGSFVRPTRPADPVRSFTQAIYAKYVSERDEYNALLLKDGKYEPETLVISGKEVEEVGFDKIREQLADVKGLRIVLLRGLRICRPQARSLSTYGDKHKDESLLHDVSTTCPNVTELDLSFNLFEEWSEVLAIVRQLPRLTSLKACANRFRCTDTTKLQCVTEKPFSTLTSLGLDDTFLSWGQICQIAVQFPGLIHLSVGGNGMQIIEPTTVPLTIKSLNLERNLFKSLEDLGPLLWIRTLSEISLKQNKIRSVAANNKEMHPSWMAEQIYSLDLAFNEIDKWAFVDSLSQALPGLRSLRMSHNPLSQGLSDTEVRTLSTDDVYLLTLARISHLQTLNFSKISAKERENAESWYLSLIRKELSQHLPALHGDILRHHPRYKNLCETYGNIQTPGKTEKAAKDLNLLAGRFIDLEIELSASVGVQLKSKQCDADKDGLKARLPRAWTVYTLASYVGKELDVSPMSIDFILKTADSESQDEHLIPRTRLLGSWIEGLEARVVVEWKDDAALRSARAPLLISSFAQQQCTRMQVVSRLSKSIGYGTQHRR